VSGISWVSASPQMWGQVHADAMEFGLQLERRDAAAGGVGKEARRPADARADIEHVALPTEPQEASRIANGVGAMIVPLVEREELLGPDRITGPDALRRQPALDAVDVGI